MTNEGRTRKAGVEKESRTMVRVAIESKVAVEVLKGTTAVAAVERKKTIHDQIQKKTASEGEVVRGTQQEDRLTRQEDRLTRQEDRLTRPEDQLTQPEDQLTQQE